MSVNKFLFTGNLTRDAELASTSTGRARGRLRLAVNQHWTDGQGEKQERADYFNITVWGKDAENAARYLGKGSKVFVEGRIESTEYEKDGERQFGNDFVATNIDFIDTRKPGQDNA